MKGIIFNLLEEAVTTRFGAAVWDDLLDDTALDGAYTSLGDYPDAEVAALVEAAAQKLSISRAETLRWFGRQAMPILKRRYEGLFSDRANSRAFVLSVNSIIHPEVRKLYPRASCPFFHLSEAGAGSGTLVVDYDSPRRMCHLAQGFIEGAAELWRDRVTVEHESCVHEGAQTCRLAVTWG